ncbi:MAG TPA: aldo/keto reductase [Chloroflexota bacterium]|nr:aldo/keto reductase [Chloroflexota bacterium]
METRQFGTTGVEVSPITLGSWPMSGDRYGAIDDTEAVNTIRRAREQGITSFDTAPGYGTGHAEETLGAALAGAREGAVVTTKCGMVPGPGGRNARDSSRASMLREIDDSLRRLRTDQVDVYLVHWPDPKTPLEETMSTLDDIQRAGKTRLVGVSNFDVPLLERCLQLRSIDVVQVGYNLFDRRMEREVFPFCRAHHIGVMAYGSLAYGLLTGGFTADTTFDPTDWRSGGVAFGQPILGGDNFRHNVELVNRLRDEVAAPMGLTVAQLALAWVLRNPVVTTAMVGARVPAEIEENVGAAQVHLTDDDAARIEALMADVAGQVDVFRPFSSAMEVWS